MSNLYVFSLINEYYGDGCLGVVADSPECAQNIIAIAGHKNWVDSYFFEPSTPDNQKYFPDRFNPAQIALSLSDVIPTSRLLLSHIFPLLGQQKDGIKFDHYHEG